MTHYNIQQIQQRLLLPEHKFSSFQHRKSPWAWMHNLTDNTDDKKEDGKKSGKKNGITCYFP